MRRHHRVQLPGDAALLHVPHRRIAATPSCSPSEQDPTSSLFLAELALEAGLPPGVLNVVHGGPDIANGLCEHPDIKAVSFIGSTRVGTEIYNRASPPASAASR